jgi:hypothetical protein
MSMEFSQRKLGRLAAVFLTAWVAFGAVACSSSGRDESAPLAAPAEKPAEAKDTTVRNVTDKAVGYTIRPLFSSVGPMKRSIASGAVDRFPGGTSFDLEFSNGAETKLYRIDSGTAHSFRLDEKNLLELFLGAHGREDVLDLAPFVPTPMPVVEKMLDLAEVAATDVLYDLGCGDGRILITAARKFGARGVGIDIVPERIAECLAGAKEAGVADFVEFRLGDAMALDISPATIVTLYLLPESNLLLRPKLESQLKPGTRVVSHNYSIEGWDDKGLKSETLTDEKGTEHTVYLYKR